MTLLALQDKLNEQNAIIDFLANGSTQLSSMAEPSQPDGSIPPTNSLAEPSQRGGSIPPTEPQGLESDEDIAPARPKKRRRTANEIANEQAQEILRQ